MYPPPTQAIRGKVLSECHKIEARERQKESARLAEMDREDTANATRRAHLSRRYSLLLELKTQVG